MSDRHAGVWVPFDGMAPLCVTECGLIFNLNVVPLKSSTLIAPSDLPYWDRGRGFSIHSLWMTLRWQANVSIYQSVLLITSILQQILFLSTETKYQFTLCSSTLLVSLTLPEVTKVLCYYMGNSPSVFPNDDIKNLFFNIRHFCLD